ncbi:hypothetical protein GUJ93_ZPchr0458g22471 [Zizania palustris]|uniref:Uncharacterized protein n=1 Tax=Zizania palustris TaxID=103762 RepID=A0A8J5QVD8_ZIZPA|nr:hypothetical protein GUJ93_ZPchr0458g22471 [Zizania palustris]
MRGRTGEAGDGDLESPNTMTTRDSAAENEGDAACRKRAGRPEMLEAPMSKARRPLHCTNQRKGKKSRPKLKFYCTDACALTE